MDGRHTLTILLTVVGGGIAYGVARFLQVPDPAIYGFVGTVAIFLFRVLDTRTTRAVKEVNQTLRDHLDVRLGRIDDKVGSIETHIQDSPARQRMRDSAESLLDFLTATSIGQVTVRSEGDFDDGAWRTPQRKAGEIRNFIRVWLRDNEHRIHPSLEEEARCVLEHLEKVDGQFSPVHYAIKAKWNKLDPHYRSRAETYLLYSEAMAFLKRCGADVEALKENAGHLLRPSE